MKKISFVYCINLFFILGVLIFVSFLSLGMSILFGKVLEGLFSFKFSGFETICLVATVETLSIFVFFKSFKIDLKSETFEEFINFK